MEVPGRHLCRVLDTLRHYTHRLRIPFLCNQYRADDYRYALTADYCAGLGLYT